jgi:hypothetical protein
MSQYSHRPLFRALVPTVALFCGCSGSSHPATSPIAGTVSYKGSAVDGAIVVFTPSAGTGNAATATTDSQGTFRLSTFGEYDGAPAGEYRVTITKMAKEAGPPKTREQINQESLPMGAGNPAPAAAPPASLVPPKYAAVATTPLEFTVKPGTNEEARFDLVD